MSIYDQPKTTHYIVWWIPQIPGKAFEVGTDSAEFARKLEGVLADYDLFQFEHRIKPDYSNMGGTVEWDDDEGAYIDVDWDEFSDTRQEEAQ